tara:strand:- start:3280 stop:3765 length:486 start_codon:yes stop_codon:yes gene_type:complete
MTQLIDSKKQKLTLNQVILLSLSNLSSIGALETDIKTASDRLIGMLSNKEIKGMQIGNTLFVMGKDEGKNNKKMQGEVYNADARINFMDNLVKHMAYLQEMGVTDYRLEIKNNRLIRAYKALNSRLKKFGTRSAVMPVEGLNNLLVKFGKKPIKVEDGKRR